MNACGGKGSTSAARPLERYRDLVPEWELFVEHLRRPEPTTLRVRRGRIAPGDLAARLERRGFGVEEVPGLDGVLRIAAGPYAPAQTPEHWLGLFYLQQASTAAAVPALGAAPGERILDLCAAPGGKATHLGEVVGEGGAVVANDPVDGRLRALLGNIYRLGLSNVFVTSADGRQLPEGATFDRVLVDVPCSAEGALRGREEGTSSRAEEGFRKRITEVQEGLLRKAVRMVRPGGVVLYVTCTYAPEENEAVVDRVLRDAPARVEPIPLDLRHAPGVASFEGVRFDPSLRDAWRIYPHHLDSGGLFLCRLRKEGDAAPEGWRPVPSVFPGDGPSPAGVEERVERGCERLRNDLGIPPDTLPRCSWLGRGKSVWLHTLGAWPLDAWGPPPQRGWRVIALGLRAFKPDPRMEERPTNELLRLLGPAIRRNVLDLPRSAWLPFLADRRLSWEASANHGVTWSEGERPRGLVALRLDGRVVGRGWAGREALRLEIPKARAGRLREVVGEGG